MKKYEYVWLDGYQPEPYLRSKVKVTSDRNPPSGLLMDHQLNRLTLKVQIVFLFLCKNIKNPYLVTHWLCVECKQVPVKLIQLT